MKSCLATALLALGALSGCSTWGPERIDTTGGHPVLGATQPMTPAALDAEVDTGRLLVKTGAAGGSAVAYPGYKVYDQSGLKVAHQAVQTGNGTEGAAELKLAPGRYFVRLDAPGQGPREFWVTVERAKVTRIDNNTRNGTPPTVR